jgi:hypothetical protein
MGRRGLEQVLLALRAGEVSLDRFFREADGDLRRMAEALYKRWVLPPDVAPEDLYQQMSLSICEERRDQDWDPARVNKKGQAIPIVTHVLYHAHVAAKRWLHGQRGAKRRSGKEMSRFPICMSALCDTDDDEFSLVEQVVNATQEEEHEARRVCLEVYDVLPLTQAVAWAVYVKEGDEEQAARRIGASAGLGSTCCVSTVDEARVIVKQAVKEGRAVARGMTA